MELVRINTQQYEMLKELGFPVNNTSKHPTPTLAFVSKWLREEKNIDINVLPNFNSNGRIYHCQVIIFHPTTVETKQMNQPGPTTPLPLTVYQTHEEAESSGLDYVINKLINSKK